MRNLSKIIEDEIKYDMAHKLNGINIELMFQIDNHSRYLTVTEKKKMVQFVNYLQRIVNKLREGLWKNLILRL